jgi:hypothetical protein
VGFFVAEAKVGVAHRARSLGSNLKPDDKMGFELGIPSLWLFDTPLGSRTGCDSYDSMAYALIFRLSKTKGQL